MNWRIAIMAACAAFSTFTACSTPRPTEFVLISFTTSVETRDWESWDFELESCQDFEDPRVDDEFLREHLLAAIGAQLGELGYEHRPGEQVDFTVFYELFTDDGGGLDGVAERARGRVFLRDTATGRTVWRGERKAPARTDGARRSEEEVIAAIGSFVREVLYYPRLLERARPADGDPGE